MRLARLAAVGLAIGVIAGFAIALLRPRPQVRPRTPDREGRAHDPAEKPVVNAGQSSVLDMRTRRRVTG